MSTWPALFRILLGTLLLLNVIGTAAAGAMHAAGAHGAGQLRQGSAEAACHGDEMAGNDLESPSAPASGCCDDGACTTCASFAQAVPSQPPVVTTAWTFSVTAPDPAPGYANAALQRLVRPPIG